MIHASSRDWRKEVFAVNILVVDDDPEILSLIRRGLVFEGYSVSTAADGKEALRLARDDPPDLVVLDIMLPELDGLEVCRRLRQVSRVPVLMLTAKGTVPDKVAGLDSGADDYLVKPFAFDELLARIRALQRRAQPANDTVMQFGDLVLDTASREVKRGGQPVHLTTKEFELLELFMRHPRQVLTREIIFDRVWGYDFGGESNIIEVYVRYLRAKLETDVRSKLIHTVRGIGYMLKE